MIVAVALGFLVVNVASHALNQTKKTPVDASVLAVRPLAPSTSEITFAVTSLSSTSSKVTCLVGIEMPSTPLAYPIKVSESLEPHQTKTVTVVRNKLLRPYADRVTVADVALVCT